MKRIDYSAIGSLHHWEGVVGMDTLLFDVGLAILNGTPQLKILVSVFLTVIAIYFFFSSNTHTHHTVYTYMIKRVALEFKN